MKKKFLNPWFVAVIIAIFYVGFFFVLLNLINPAGNRWTVSEFTLLLGNLLISMCSIYASHLLTKRYGNKLSLGYRYGILLLLSVPLYCVVYLFYWVVVIRQMIYGLPTDQTAYAGQVWFNITGLHIPTALIVIISLYNSYSHRTEMQLVKMQGLATETQLRNLQQRVDPHFLFNSLNILSALIKMDADKSVLFTQKLSEVYRFLLNTQNEALISLEDEIGFVNDYFFLITCRFGGSFLLEITCEEQLRLNQLYIVPGTLQLLVENVIKHNTANEEDPIVIQVSVGRDRLLVMNRIEKKESPSSGFGFLSLAMRYALLNNEKVTFCRKDNFFQVSVPLIKQLA